MNKERPCRGGLWSYIDKYNTECDYTYVNILIITPVTVSNHIVPAKEPTTFVNTIRTLLYREGEANGKGMLNYRHKQIKQIE